MIRLGSSVRFVILFIVIIPIGCGIPENTTNSKKHPKANELPTIPVTVADIQLRSIQRVVPVVGTFYGFEEIALSNKVEGVVKKIYHDVGDQVKSGDILLELDPVDAKLAVEEATENLKIELARLGLKEVPEPDFNIEKLPSVQKATVLLERATRAFERAKAMRAKNAISPSDFDAVEADYRIASAERLEAVIQANALVISALEKSVKLRIAQQRLLDTVLKVPTLESGPKEFMVAARMVSEGEQLRTMNAPSVFRLVIIDPLKLKATIPERFVAEIKVGHPVRVTVESYPGQQFDGVITRIDPTIDVINRTFKIEATFTNHQYQLRPGNFARASIVTKNSENCQTVPIDAVVSFAGIDKIFVIENERARAIQVQLGTRGRDWIEIKSELPPQAKVVVTGQSALVDGSPVRIRNMSSE